MPPDFPDDPTMTQPLRLFSDNSFPDEFIEDSPWYSGESP